MFFFSIAHYQSSLTCIITNMLLPSCGQIAKLAIPPRNKIRLPKINPISNVLCFALIIGIYFLMNSNYLGQFVQPLTLTTASFEIHLKHRLL